MVGVGAAVEVDAKVEGAAQNAESFLLAVDVHVISADGDAGHPQPCPAECRHRQRSGGQGSLRGAKGSGAEKSAAFHVGCSFRDRARRPEVRIRQIGGSIRVLSGRIFRLGCALCLFAAAQPQPGPLSQLSAGFQQLSRRVQASVVRVNSVGYRQLEPEESEEPGVAARQQSSGSGVIIDPEGLIVTNAHVVVGSQRVQVTLPPRPGEARARSRSLRAEVVGLDLETDWPCCASPKGAARAPGGGLRTA